MGVGSSESTPDPSSVGADSPAGHERAGLWLSCAAHDAQQRGLESGLDLCRRRRLRCADGAGLMSLLFVVANVWRLEC